MNRGRDNGLFVALMVVFLLSGPLSAIAQENEKSIREMAASLKVEDLPLSYQFTDEELNALLAAYKEEPRVVTGVVRSAVIDCENCAVLLRGNFLRPPFKIEMNGEAVYINGFQFEPEPQFPMVTNARYEEHRKIEIKEEQEKRDKDPCVKIKRTIYSQVTLKMKECREVIDVKERESCVRRILGEMNVEILRLLVQNNNDIFLEYRQLPCIDLDIYSFAELSPADLEHYKWITGISDQERKLLFLNNGYSLLMEISSIKNRVLAIVNRHSLGGPEIKSVFIFKEIIETNADPRIILYLLAENNYILPEGAFLLANKERFTKEVEKWRR